MSKTRHFKVFKYQKLKGFLIESKCKTKNKLQREIYIQQKDTFHRYKDNIKEARIYRSTWCFIEKDVMAMTNLVRLSLRRINYIKKPTTKISIHSLKELEIDSSPSFFDVPNLKKLNINEISLPIEFIETCRNLKHLTYKVIVEDVDDLPAELSVNFPHLTSLKTYSREKSLISLLDSQKDSLKKLEMNSYEHGEVEFAINHMRRLEKLYVWMPSDLLILSKNTGIKELILKSVQSHFSSKTKTSVLRAIWKVLESCSSTQKLTIELSYYDIQATVMIASIFLPNLTDLIINGQYKDEPRGKPPLYYFKTFDSLKLISFMVEDNMDAQLKLLANCTALHKLVINSFFQNIGGSDIKPVVSNELQRILENVPDLEELIAIQTFLLNNDVIEILKKSKIRILNFTVYEDVFDEQQKLALYLAKHSNIKCTVFCMKIIEELSDRDFADFDIYEDDDVDYGFFDDEHFGSSNFFYDRDDILIWGLPWDV